LPSQVSEITGKSRPTQAKMESLLS